MEVEKRVNRFADNEASYTLTLTKWTNAIAVGRRLTMAKSSGGVRGGANTGGGTYGKIMSIIADIESNGYSRQSPFSIGNVDSDLKKYASEHGIEIGNGQLYMSQKQIVHTMRDLHTEKGINISPQKLASFPDRKSGMSLYHDSKGDKFVYFDGSAKYVVEPNYSLKLPSGRERVVNFITAYTSNVSEFNQRNFTKIR